MGSRDDTGDVVLDDQGDAVTEVHRVTVVIREDDEEVGFGVITYFAGQPYAVMIDTPDGVDWQLEFIAGAIRETL